MLGSLLSALSVNHLNKIVSHIYDRDKHFSSSMKCKCVNDVAIDEAFPIYLCLKKCISSENHSIANFKILLRNSMICTAQHFEKSKIIKFVS